MFQQGFLNSSMCYIHHNLSADPSMTVRADITGRYSNRMYAYEPTDAKLCKCSGYLTYPAYSTLHCHLSSANRLFSVSVKRQRRWIPSKCHCHPPPQCWPTWKRRRSSWRPSCRASGRDACLTRDLGFVIRGADAVLSLQFTPGKLRTGKSFSSTVFPLWTTHLLLFPFIVQLMYCCTSRMPF